MSHFADKPFPYDTSALKEPEGYRVKLRFGDYLWVDPEHADGSPFRVAPETKLLKNVFFIKMWKTGKSKPYEKAWMIEMERLAPSLRELQKYVDGPGLVAFKHAFKRARRSK